LAHRVHRKHSVQVWQLKALAAFKLKISVELKLKDRNRKGNGWKEKHRLFNGRSCRLHQPIAQSG